MRPQERDPGYVWDMLDAARSVRDFMSGIAQDEYLKDRKLQLAVERALESTAEGARRPMATVIRDAHSCRTEVPLGEGAAGAGFEVLLKADRFRFGWKHD